MLDEEIYEKVKKMISETLGVDEKEVKPEAKLVDELGVDSIGMLDLLLKFEDEFNISIPDQDAEKITRVQDIIDYLKTKI
ncbi:MAG: acyl carrier protein [Omnitrophica WOR_2 bacterium RBG_13_44_8]|nr:MAG: acyl carrier protein [Omnitrophica WOR_2 bacterium RBG_13_44_8]